MTFLQPFSPAMSYWPGNAYSPAALPVSQAQANAMAPEAQAEHYKTAGNEFRKRRLFPQAAAAYEAAIRINPHYTDAYYNYAQLMTLTGDIPKAIQLLTQLLFINPNDHDARVTLGENWERLGNTQEAKKRYMEVLSSKPDFDPAKRRLNYLLYLDQKRFYPETAEALLKTQYREVVYKARELLKEYFTQYHPNPVLLKLSQTLPIVFEETQALGESQNQAEYDAQRNLFRMHPQMLFSTPNVVGAYLAHEARHAVDEDSQTSVAEEQDGYQELARFWSIYKGAEDDPNLDRALSLYRRNLESLNQEVRRVYTIRDATMPETSPGHGQPAKNALGKAFQAYEVQAAQTGLKQLKALMAAQTQRMK